MSSRASSRLFTLVVLLAQAWLVALLAVSPAGAVSLWSNSATPDVASYSGGSPFELGVSFTSDVSGTITALRFYKSPMDKGSHTAHLWSSSGALLASAPSNNETAAGWQQVSLLTPVPIQAGAVYVASYSESSGYYPVSRGYFTTGTNNPPLHALADGASARNGVYSYSPGTFPNQSDQSTNYWVDVVFNPNGSSPAPGAPNPALTTSPASLGFGNVTVGNSTLLPVVLTSTGTASLTVSQVAASGAGFSLSGPALPLILAPGNNVTFTIRFAPVGGGSASGSVSVASNSSTSPNVVLLTGTGLKPHSVALTWEASPSPNVIGYNVYRASSSGGPYTRINSAPIAGLAYTDSTVQSGETYFFCSTAIDSSGLESAHSNSVQAVIPFP
ncbi:MAG: DUF4082 domain-containing protein [Terriglobia bacterium]